MLDVSGLTSTRYNGDSDSRELVIPDERTVNRHDSSNVHKKVAIFEQICAGLMQRDLEYQLSSG